MYCSPKILRNIENVRERPIISNYEIPMENVSKCLDFHLKNDLQGGISYEKSFNDFKSKMSTFLSLSLSCSLCNCWCNWAIPEYNSWDWFIDMFFKVIGYGHRLKICFIICLYLYEYIRNKCSQIQDFEASMLFLVHGKHFLSGITARITYGNLCINMVRPINF